MAREKTFENQLVERASLFWVFLVPFAQKVFFFNQLFLFRSSFVSFSRCSMFSLVVARRVEKKLG